ncbi:MAG: hypothetical protein ABSG14_04875 [Verrucomicrobiia bacterium]
MNKDQRWTRAVMERDSWMCQNCGTTKHLDAAHIVSRHVKQPEEKPLANTDVHLIYKEIMDQAGSRIYRPRQIYVGQREQHYVPIEKRNKVS